MRKSEVFVPRRTAGLSASDLVVLAGLTVLLYGGLRLALAAPTQVQGPEISLSIAALPRYAVYSVARMTAAYVLSLLFSLIYAYAAARNHLVEQVLMPLLDILQSIPILSFLPVVLLSLSALLPEALAVELAAVALIFTSQAWNMTFSLYQSFTTVPNELKEAAATFRLGRWLRLRHLEMPFATIGLIWNSMMSWSGGWFFLMAAETFVVGRRDFRLPGLGSYLYKAADLGDTRAILWGLGALVLVIVLLDQLVWRPALAWADRFKLESVEADEPPTSWFYDLLASSVIIAWLRAHIIIPFVDIADRALGSPSGQRWPKSRQRSRIVPTAQVALLIALGALLLYGCFRAAQMLATLSLASLGHIALAVLATSVRVTAALLITLIWTLPVGVAIGTNRRLATVLQPLVQTVAAIPATALFPIILLFMVGLPGGLNIAAVVLMLMGTQWYLLFNIIAGAAAIPEDLRYTTRILKLGRAARWRTLILPAIFPYLVTGLITAGGGAWNASIVAEYVTFGGQRHQVLGIGAVIAEATGAGDYALLLAGTLALALTVVLLNRLLWRRLYVQAAERYRLE